jgi:hypothetical protein
VADPRLEQGTGPLARGEGVPYAVLRGATPVLLGSKETIAVRVSPDLLAITREWKPDFVQMSRSPLS